MSEPLTIWGRADSSNVQAVMWGVGELGLEYSRHDVGHRFGGTDTPEFIARNPNRTVPVLGDGSLIIWESTAILRYLADAYGQPPFWPETPAGKAPINQWGDWGENCAGVFNRTVFWPLIRLPDQGDRADRVAKAMETLTPSLAIADDQLSRHDHIAGDAFTLADILFGHILHRYFTVEAPRPELPALAAYFARLQDRAAYRAHAMVSYAALQA